MQVTPCRTPIIRVGDALTDILDDHLPAPQERDVVAVTSKIVSICQGRVVKKTDSVDKHALVRREAQYYLEPGPGSHRIFLTITRDVLIATAGIDESNGDGYYILWPERVQHVAQTIWNHLRRKHQLTHLGVLITDSHTTPLRRGVTGLGLAWCGFRAIKNYVGTPDIFGKPLRVTTTNVLDGLAVAAVLTMGEGAEQTPLAVIHDVPFVDFQDGPPSREELDEVRIELDDDLRGGSAELAHASHPWRTNSMCCLLCSHSSTHGLYSLPQKHPPGSSSIQATACGTITSCARPL